MNTWFLLYTVDTGSVQVKKKKKKLKKETEASEYGPLCMDQKKRLGVAFRRSTTSLVARADS